MNRLCRTGLAALLIVFVLPAAHTAEPPAEPVKKVLRLGLRSAETGFDPAQINDLYSRQITAHIFEGLYTYDHLARPYKLKPLTADGLPESSPDFKTWTVRIKPGIYFADDPAFEGKKRELVAADFVYSFKRFFDPALKSPAYNGLAEDGIVGLETLRAEALKSKQPFDYGREVEGVKALDRYTLRFTLTNARPRFVNTLADSSIFGAVAREVIERYPGDAMAHPVGTGPYMLKQWRRSSLIALERNPAYRERYFDAEPNADDAEGQALLARLKGRRLPMIDRVELSVIEQSQPRWLAFLNGQIDLIDPVPPDLAKAAVPNAKLAPNLAKQGIHAHSIVNSDVGFTYFNMEDPLVGGLTAEKVALRRAIGLAYDVQAEIRLVRNGQAIAAQGPVVPHTYGYDPKLKTINSDFDPARANALLDLFGYKDRDGDGWRETPDGAPLVLEISTQADELARQLDDQKRKSLGLIGIRSRLRIQQFAENLKAGRAGKLMVWSLASSAASPDGFGGLARVYGPQSGAQNFARFKLPAVDAIYQRMNELPDGPERLGLFNEVVKLVVAYAPYKYHTHRIYVDLTQPWLIGYRRPLFWQEQWHFMDVDMVLRSSKLD